MVGQEDVRWPRWQFDHRDPDPAVLDREDEPATQHRREVGHVRRHVATRRVHEVEALEP